MTTSLTKPFEWKDIVQKLNITEEITVRNKYMKYAEQYFKNFYTEFAPNQKFSKSDVEFIVKEIIDEAEHKINLHEMDERQAQLKKDNPNIDAYIDSLFKRGSYPY